MRDYGKLLRDMEAKLIAYKTNYLNAVKILFIADKYDYKTNGKGIKTNLQ